MLDYCVGRLSTTKTDTYKCGILIIAMPNDNNIIYQVDIIFCCSILPYDQQFIICCTKIQSIRSYLYSYQISFQFVSDSFIFHRTIDLQPKVYFDGTKLTSTFFRFVYLLYMFVLSLNEMDAFNKTKVIVNEKISTWMNYFPFFFCLSLM